MLRAKVLIPIRSRASVLGFVLAALMAAGLLVDANPARADLTFTVNSAADPGSGGCNSSECTLREAISVANRVPGPDTIRFDIPGDSAKTINVFPQLPAITEAVTIDGYTQPGASENIVGQGATNAVIKIELNGGKIAESGNGLEILADGVVVRGLAIGNFERNGISIGQNNPDGVFEPSGVKIEGNFIGTDASGTVLRANRFNGVNSGTDGENNVIGGTTPEARNLLSGNSTGVNISGSKGGYTIVGNLIGTKKDGTDGSMGNRSEGMRVVSPGNTVGGTVSGASNSVAFNGSDGVEVGNFDTTIGNRILGNSIFSNGELGIDLSEDGRTANDPKDPDTGPNNLQNFPVVTSAEKASGGKTTIKGKLDSTPSTKKKKKSFTVQFFSNPQGEDEGKTFLGQQRMSTNRKGQASFTFETTRTLTSGEKVTATATDSKGNTSEFSDPRAVTLAPGLG